MDDVPDFSGKVLGLYIADMSEGDSGIVMEFPTFEVQGGRLFLVGRNPRLEDDTWFSNLSVGVAWDSIAYYFVFDSREHYLERHKRMRVPLRRRLFGRST